jgi:hypothetical protein
MVLLAVYLIVTGLLFFVHVDFQYLAAIMALLAIAAGVLILLDR